MKKICKNCKFYDDLPETYQGIGRCGKRIGKEDNYLNGSNISPNNSCLDFKPKNKP